MSFEGEIGEIDLIEKLVELGRESFTGAIRFENDGIIKIIYFKTGDILSASTNDRSDSIDEILLRAGKVTREHIKQALARRKESETLGDAMLGLGFITRKELTWARRAQAIGILRSLRGWTAGQYTIVADYLPKREEGTLFPLPQMLVELIVTETDRSRFDRATDGGSAIFQKAASFDETFRKLGLNQDAEDIVQYIDGRNSAADVAAASGKDAFNVYKLLEALRALGLLTKAQAFSQVSTFDDFEQAGVADAADAWQTTEEVAQPTFDLDDEPALTYTPAAPLPDVEDDQTPSFDWDQPAVPPAVDLPAPMPTWEAEPRAVTREVPAVTPPLPLAPLDREPQWGFDEAQIETARRAAVPVRTPSAPNDEEFATEVVQKAAKANRVVGVLLSAVGLLILAAAGWFGYGWWLQRNAPAPVAVTQPVRRRPRIVTPSPVTETTASSALSTSGTTPATTTGTTTGGVTASPGSMSTAPHAGALVVNATPTTTTIATTTLPPNTVTTATTATHPAAPVTAAVRPPVTATRAAAVPPRPVPATRITASSTAAPGPPSTTQLQPSTPTSNAKITNSGATSNAKSTNAGASDATRAKYDAMAREHAANATGAFTVQFELVCETASLTKAVAASDKVWFTPLTYRGRSCYRVYWGHYASAAEANAATGEIPAPLRESTPVVVRVSKQ